MKPGRGREEDDGGGGSREGGRRKKGGRRIYLTSVTFECLKLLDLFRKEEER